MGLRLSVIICAYNEAERLPACIHSVLAQTRPPDQLLVVNNASTDATRDLARAIPGVQVVDEPVKGLVRARERGRRLTDGDIVCYLDADCRAPLTWLERIEGTFAAHPEAVAVTGPYRFYDWDRTGVALVRAYDWSLAPLTHVTARLLRLGAVLYGGNFAVRRSALDDVGGFDQRIEFHGEDTNLGRRLAAVGRVVLSNRCWLHTSARRYRALGRGAVFRLYLRNFWSEIVHHQPADHHHVDVRS